VLGSNHFDCSGEHIWDLPKKPIDKENRDWQLHNDVLTTEEYTKGKDLSKLYAVIMMFLPGIFSIFYGDEVGVTGIGNILCRKPFPWGSGDSELMDFYRELGQAYSQFEFLKNANTHLIHISQDELVFERYNSKSSLCIIINRTNRERELIVPKEYQDSISLRKVFALNSDYEVLGPYGAMVFEF
jgi:glycosidase